MSLGVNTDEELLDFTPSFRIAKPAFYFHHIVNPDEATLTVEVLGPNLGFTFGHKRAKEIASRAHINNILTNKTTGFLTLVGSQQRMILAWSESGHGCGKMGDILDVPSEGHEGAALPNAIWTRRGIHLAKLMGLAFASPFDNPGARTMTVQERLARRGVYQGGHVEVKLATYAIFAMLEFFGITEDLNNVTRRHLEQLKTASCTDRSRPRFEIYFSRKNCARCGLFAQALEEITGISMKLCWKERLVQKEYPKRKKRPYSLFQRRAAVTEPEATAGDEQMVIDVDQDSDIEDDDGGCVEEDEDEIMTIDLTLDPSAIDLTGGDDCEPMPTVDLTADPAVATPGPPADNNDNRVDDYVSGLAYCVGQFGEAATPARIAIVDLARLMKAHRGAQATTSVRKPLPATEVTEEPEFLLGQPVSSIERILGSRPVRAPQATPILRRTSAQPISPPLTPQSPEMPLDQASSEDGSSSNESIPSSLSLRTPPPSQRKEWRAAHQDAAIETPTRAPRGTLPFVTYYSKANEDTISQEDEEMTTGWLDAPSPF
ncbi:unnamed protein product [Clonostachys chloroleuca]|uniref:Uncharacterized protein n=1 Tax=Clonostachys chloroleuca TaxID=1926264 RepID=A0AA35LPN7_9HYPO|nr:unnamed protein product [Clonostachys chloroleuca]